jgi:hypothetical protein
LLDYELEDVYNTDETKLYFKVHPNKTLAQGKVKGQKLQKERVTLVVISTGIDNLKLLIIYSSKQPQCFGRFMSTFGGTQIEQLGCRRMCLKLRFCSSTITSKAKIER